MEETDSCVRQSETGSPFVFSIFRVNRCVHVLLVAPREIEIILFIVCRLASRGTYLLHQWPQADLNGKSDCIALLKMTQNPAVKIHA
eukprot:scaffold19808_cov184-Skeletonema_dohrnii-CCMP3373.AAC.1